MILDIVHERRFEPARIAFFALMIIPAGLLALAVINLGSNAKTTHKPAHTVTASLAVPAPIPVPPDMAALEQAAFRADAWSRLQNLTHKSVRVKPGATLAGLLQDEGISRSETASAISALARVYNLRHLRAGQNLALTLETPQKTVAPGETPAPVRLAGLIVRPEATRTVVLERNHNGVFKARALEMEVQKQTARAAGKINTSLYVDGLAAGASDATIAEFAQLFAYSVDFQRGMRPGDAFDIVFEQVLDDRGNRVKTGNILYAMLAPRGKERAYYRFETADGDIGYYDKNGQSARRFLMKTPVKGARISSRYGRRHHPVLGYTKMHKGIDFAAPRGTPIMAAGNGVVERASRFGSFGNYVRIRHANGYKTAYAHMSRFGRGVRKGKHVQQGQIIGYIGTTGRSTGPHLHYEVLKGRRQVNPMTVNVPTGRKLNAAEKKLFDRERLRIDALRTTTMAAQKTASASAG